MFVKAAKGIQVPFEQNPRRYVVDSAITKVEETAYYARRISDGDLIEVTEQDWDEQQKTKAEAEAEQQAAAEKAAALAAKKTSKKE